jgi:hypothetical protein
MFFHKQFERFDPLIGDVPELPFTYLPEIAERARSILRRNSFIQLDAAAKRISKEIDIYLDDLKYVAVSELKSKLEAEGVSLETYFEWDGGTEANGSWVFKDDMVDDLEILTESNCSEVDVLKTIINDRDFIFFSPEGAPEPEPVEYPEGKAVYLFAVLSLWLLADAIEWSKKGGKYSLCIAGEFAIKSMDAVCYGEHLLEIDFHADYLKKQYGAEQTGALRKQHAEYEKSTKQAKSERAKDLNRLRHAPTNHAKKVVTAEWGKNPSQFASAEKAGKYFADWLEDQGIVKSIEPRTVTGWIRDYAKEFGVKLR